MDHFHKDILRFGSLVGLRYFQFYLRGREELVVTVTLTDSTTKVESKHCYLITLYYKKGVPIVYELKDSTVEGGKTAEEQTEISLKTVNNWKKNSVPLRCVLEDLLIDCATKKGITVKNPFEVDRDFFTTMCEKPASIIQLFPRSSHIISSPKQVSLLAALTSGALVSVLGECFIASPDYAKSLFEDITYLTEFHFNHSLRIGIKD